MFLLLAPAFLTCNNSGSQTGTGGTEKATSAMSTKEKNTIRFYFTPSLRKDRMEDQINEFTTFLSERTDMNFVPVIPGDYEAMIDDFGEDNADMALMNTLSFVSVSKKFGATARLKSIKYGKDSYKGQIIANTRSGIDGLEDLNGKKFAFTNKNSTSGFLYPAKILIEHGIKPEKTIYAEEHDRVVEMVYRGMADAGATFYAAPGENGEIRDARAKLLDKHPDIAERVAIIQLTESIPNDPLVFRKDLSEELISTICDAVRKFAETPEGKSILTDLYGTEGFVSCTNNDYASMFDAVEKSNIF